MTRLARSRSKRRVRAGRRLKVGVKAVPNLPLVIYYYYVPNSCRGIFVEVGLVFAAYELVHVGIRADAVRAERDPRDKGPRLGFSKLVVLALCEEV